MRAYGLIGAVFVLALWLMVLSTLTFAGALIGALMSERTCRPSELVQADVTLSLR